MNIFGKKKPKTQLISAVKYPDRILFETNHQIKNSYWIVSSEITFLNITASDSKIGETVIKHLELSKFGINNPSHETWKEIQENYKKATGLKTTKAQMKDALSVSISRENGQIILTPMKNGGSSGENRGFFEMIDEIIEIEDTKDFDLIGVSLKKAWSKCK